MTELVVAVVFLLLISAWASGTEAAVFAIPYSKVLSFVEDKRRGAVTLKKIKDDMARPIMAIVIINNMANILGSIMVGGMAAKQFQSYQWGPINGVAVFSSFLTFLVIAFAEIVPKTIGERRHIQKFP